jgi:hypothetical protein
MTSRECTRGAANLLSDSFLSTLSFVVSDYFLSFVVLFLVDVVVCRFGLFLVVCRSLVTLVGSIMTIKVYWIVVTSL